MKRVKKAVEDARSKEASARTDRSLADALSIFCEVSNCKNDEVTSTARHVAASMAMLVPLCEYFTPGTVPSDFPTIDVFKALADAPAFEPIANQIIEHVAFISLSEATRNSTGATEEDSAEYDSAETSQTTKKQQRGLTPQKSSREMHWMQSMSTDASASMLSSLANTKVTPTSWLGCEDIGPGAIELGRLLTMGSRAIGLPIAVIEPLVTLLATVKELVDVYNNTRSVSATWRFLKKNWRTLARVLLMIVRYCTATVLASDESMTTLSYWTRPISSVINGIFVTDRDWRYLHPSANDIWDVINTAPSDGRSWYGFGRVFATDNDRIVKELRSRLAGYTDQVITYTILPIPNHYDTITGMKELKAWIDVVKNNRSKYAGLEFFSMFLSVAMVLLNHSSIGNAFGALVTRCSGPLEEQIMVKLQKILDDYPDINMNRNAIRAHKKLNRYAVSISDASIRNKIDKTVLIHLITKLGWVRCRAKLEQGCGIVSGNLILFQSVLNEFDQMQIDRGDSPLAIGCSLMAASYDEMGSVQGSVVNEIFAKHLVI